MGKKATENRYGVQVGDIFVQHCYFEDFGSYNFYQVTALRGETQVVVRPIKKNGLHSMAITKKLPRFQVHGCRRKHLSEKYTMARI